MTVCSIATSTGHRHPCIQTPRARLQTSEHVSCTLNYAIAQHCDLRARALDGEFIIRGSEHGAPYARCALEDADIVTFEQKMDEIFSDSIKRRIDVVRDANRDT